MYFRTNRFVSGAATATELVRRTPPGSRRISPPSHRATGRDFVQALHWRSCSRIDHPSSGRSGLRGTHHRSNVPGMSASIIDHPQFVTSHPQAPGWTAYSASPIWPEQRKPATSSIELAATRVTSETPSTICRRRSDSRLSWRSMVSSRVVGSRKCATATGMSSVGTNSETVVLRISTRRSSDPWKLSEPSWPQTYVFRMA